MGRSRTKRPTREQKILIAKAGYDPADWLVYRESEDRLRLVHKILGTGRVIEKGKE